MDAMASFVDEISEPILRVGLDGSLIFYNQASVPLLSHWGMSASDPVPEDIAEIIRHASAKGTPSLLDALVCHKTWEITVSPVPDKPWVNLYARNVTNQRRSETARLESEMRLRQVVRGAGLGLWDWYPQTGDVTFMGEFFRMLGYEDRPVGEYHQTVFFEAVHPEDVPRVQAAVWGSHHRGKEYNVEFRMKCADDSWKWILSSGSVVERDDNNKVVRMSGLHIDISARKHTEAEREELNRQLIQTAREAGMSEIATAVLHNVGNVLNSVQVSATMLKDQLEISRLERVSDVARMINQKIDQLGTFFAEDSRGQRLPGYLEQLAEQLAAERVVFSRELESLSTNLDHIKAIIATQQSFACTSGMVEPCRLDELVEEAVRLHSAATSRYGIVLEADLERLPELMLDKQKVMQILVNLLKNAQESLRDSLQDFKRIQITLRDLGDGRVVVKLHDNGTGIAPEMIDRIFHHGFTTKADGHGFGLHSCANFAKQMGGQLSAGSDGPGTGACFSVELPIRLPAELAQPVAY